MFAKVHSDLGFFYLVLITKTLHFQTRLCTPVALHGHIKKMKLFRYSCALLINLALSMFPDWKKNGLLEVMHLESERLEICHLTCPETLNQVILQSCLEGLF